MSDLVEREIVREKMLKYGFTAPDMTVHEFIEDELPSVTQKSGKWIPVSEREPEEENNYLVSFDDGFIATVYYADNDWELWAEAGEPIAWMSLPESYKVEPQESEDKE